MKKLCGLPGLFFLLLWMGPLLLRAQETPAILKNREVNFRGVVKSKEPNQPLVGANVLVRETKEGAYTDINGFFSFRLPQGDYTFIVSYIGYESTKVQVKLLKDTVQLLYLDPLTNFLEEIEISGELQDRNIATPNLGAARLSSTTIKALPSLLGEADVLKGLQLLPGVTSVGEGATGLNVRGGNIDQNLILMDDIPVFYSSHLLGFFSVFNPDVMRDVTFYRGGIPAGYGGRTASVLDIRLKDPAMDKWLYQGGVGLISSRFMAEGPVVPGKLSVLVAARASAPNYIFKVLPDPSLREIDANFYEFTAKIRYRFSDYDQLAFTGFFSEDAFRMPGDSLTALEVNATSTLFKWRNLGASGRWNHFFNDELSFQLAGAVGAYQPGFSIPDEAYAAEFTSAVEQRYVKASLKQFNAKHNAELGVMLAGYRIQPGDLQPASDLSAINAMTLPEERSTEAAAFVNDEWTISDNISVMAGLRYSWYSYNGPGRVFQYEPGEPRELSGITDTFFYNKGDRISTYSGFEPRLALKISTGPSGSVKFGYNRVIQYLQLVSNTTSALPTDRWKSSDPYTKPQIADQVSAGIFRNFKNNEYEAGLEGYFKWVENMPDYRSGVSLLLLEATETAVLQGKGRAYGIEVLLRKTKGRLTGWLSYTWSSTQLLIESPYEEDRTFSGKYYPANFDRPHVGNFSATYRQNRRISFSANFTFSAGRPVTFPESKYTVDGVFIPNYINRNEDRTPSYHRLDLGMKIDPDPRNTKRWKSYWSFSLYNVYARRNPYSLFFRTKNNTAYRALNKVEAYRLATIGTIVPAITYEFKF